ncbi:MAG: TonB-dependent receptor [Gammaproteobacteria bacterium]|nr:TonB-dependent receptor [Gammaproteobacteria bacterium]
MKITASIWCAICLFATGANAQEDEIVVIGITPAQSAGLAEEKIPYNVQAASAEDIERAQSLALSDFLNYNLGSVSLNEAQNNPLQPDVQFRGYTASPLLGLAQGLAVYQNGVRINEPLGDTVNWDLIPHSGIHSIALIGGTNPVFGLNTLGGALSIQMKNGFNTDGHRLSISGGSFGRIMGSVESSGKNDSLGYFVNVQYFDEDGWRDESASDAMTLYGSIGWLGADTEANLNLQHGNSNLLGNGPVPVELMAIDRSAVFTAPDRTENDMTMLSLDGSHDFTKKIELAASAFYRDNTTDALNGDASEFTLCDLGGSEGLLEGLEEEDLETIGLDEVDVCAGQFPDAQTLENFLNATALAMGIDGDFNLDDLSGELSGTGALSDQAIDNVSNRNQVSSGADIQLSFGNDLLGKSNQLILGLSYFSGDSSFDAVTELSGMDPITRSTVGLGTGTFVDELETNIDTSTETSSFYFINVFDPTNSLTLTLSGRYNDTEVELADRSGERPELNGRHNFSRFNPALGAAYEIAENMNIYGSYSVSNRAPTPIELACNNSIFDLAVAIAVAEGEDPSDVQFECRLPNAFLADPPLNDVVTKGFEAGIRGQYGSVDYHLGFFHSTNEDDIIFQTTGRSTGLFANVEETKRKGIEGMLTGAAGKIDWFLAYTFLDATFEDDFLILSPNHPFADDDGEIMVRSGNRMPGLPEHSVKLRADYGISDNVSVGVDVLYNSDQVLRGDESNQVDTLDAYVVVDLRGRYRINNNVELFARVSNLFDEEYETFGILGEEPSEVDVPLFEDFENPRFVGPAAPRAAFVGFILNIP